MDFAAVAQRHQFQFVSLEVELPDVTLIPNPAAAFEPSLETMMGVNLGCLVHGPSPFNRRTLPPGVSSSSGRAGRPSQARPKFVAGQREMVIEAEDRRDAFASHQAER